MLGWPRVRVVLVTSLVLSVIMLAGWRASWTVLIIRLVIVGMIQLLAFGLFDPGPKRSPPIPQVQRLSE